jgi:hypothetical protein
MANNNVALSKEELPISEIEAYYLTTKEALRSFYNKTNTYFTGYTIKELQAELDERINELDKSTAFTVLAAIEAHLRVDYIQRCQSKGKDDLSRKFRDLYKCKGNKASLSEDILELWKDNVCRKTVVSELKSAFNFRHWLAHGRYWVAKLGRKYDFNDVLTLAIYAQTEMRIDMGA